MTSQNQSRSSHPEVSPRRASHASAMRPTYSMSSGIALSVRASSPPWLYVICRSPTSSAARPRASPVSRPCAADPASSCRDRVDRHRTTAPWCPRAPRSCSRPACAACRIGLIATITLVALEALAIGTVLPLVGEELGQIELYGWVYSAFFLGNLLGVVVAGGALDRVPLWRPFAIGLVLFAVGLHDRRAGARRWAILVAARGSSRAWAAAPSARRRTSRSAARSRSACSRGCSRCCRPRGWCPAWSGRRSRRSSASSRRGGWCSWACCRSSRSPAGLAVTALRRIPAAAPPEEHAAAAATIRRLPNALLAAAGAGLLIAALTAQRRCVFVDRWRGHRARAPAPGVPPPTPPGTLVLAAGVPAAVLLRGVMTFAFFSGDAYIPLLLQTWRGTPATLTGLVFTGTTIAWTVATWLQARRIDVWGPHRFVAPRLRLRGDRRVDHDPGRPPGLSGRAHASSPGCCRASGMGFMYSAVTLVVLRGANPTETGAASSALQLSDILGTALGAGHRGRDHGLRHAHRRRRARLVAGGRVPDVVDRGRASAAWPRAESGCQPCAEHARRCGRLALRPAPIAPPTRLRRRRSGHPGGPRTRCPPRRFARRSARSPTSRSPASCSTTSRRCSRSPRPTRRPST